MRSRMNLLDLAGRYATERRAPVATVTKEILHYEILYALLESGAIENLTFQGGTSLRLCYQGSRYSEDLDFAGGTDFVPSAMDSFGELLKREIAEAYGLKVEIKEPQAGDLDSESGVTVSRWLAKVLVPNINRSLPQKELIKIEVASVPAYDRDLLPVSVNYAHLPPTFSQMLIPVETPTEILADKIVALGARPFFKARDIWDIKFLLDRSVSVDSAMPLVSRKLVDYGWGVDEFKDKLAARIVLLEAPETPVAFHREMSRFVDASVARQLEASSISTRYMQRAVELGKLTLDAPLALPATRPRPKG